MFHLPICSISNYVEYCNTVSSQYIPQWGEAAHQDRYALSYQAHTQYHAIMMQDTAMCKTKGPNISPNRSGKSYKKSTYVHVHGRRGEFYQFGWIPSPVAEQLGVQLPKYSSRYIVHEQGLNARVKCAILDKTANQLNQTKYYVVWDPDLSKY